RTKESKEIQTFFQEKPRKSKAVALVCLLVAWFGLGRFGPRRGPQPRLPAQKGKTEGGGGVRILLRIPLKRLDSEKEMQGNERSFTISRAFHSAPALSVCGSINSDFHKTLRVSETTPGLRHERGEAGRASLGRRLLVHRGAPLPHRAAQERDVLRAGHADAAGENEERHAGDADRLRLGDLAAHRVGVRALGEQPVDDVRIETARRR